MLDGYQVTSPDRSIETTVSVVDGTLTYELVRDGTTAVVAPSGLGFRLREPALDLTTGLTWAPGALDDVTEADGSDPAWLQIRAHMNKTAPAHRE